MTGEWKSVTAYECPVCGELVPDMDAACNHVCDHIHIHYVPTDICSDTEVLKRIIETSRSELDR